MVALGQGVKTLGMVRDMHSVVGKPINTIKSQFKTMDTFNLPNPQFKAQGKAIDWQDFNYPPLVRVVHYNPLELPMRARSIAYCLNITFLLVSFACLLNFVDTCIIVSASSAPFKWVIQSLIHALLIPGLAFVVFFVGYRGLAEEATSQAGQFMIGQLALIAVSILMSLVPFGCVNGFFKLLVIRSYINHSSALAFDVAILLESSIWMACTAMAVVTLMRVRKYDRHVDVVDKSIDASHA